MLKFMKKQPRIVTLLLVLLLPLFILSSCQEAQTTEESQATHTSTAIMVPSAYPAPQEPGRTETTMQITSGPVSTEISTDTYPGPEAGAPTNMPVEAYPQPGSQATPAQGATQMVGMAPTPTLLGAFPAPEPTQNQGNEPYPGPTNDSGLATPASSVQPTFAGTAPARGVTPTVTPTLGLLRTELTASDPRSFHIASGEVQLVEFFAFWSPESQGMAAVMNVLEQRYKDRLDVYEYRPLVSWLVELMKRIETDAGVAREARQKKG